MTRYWLIMFGLIGFVGSLLYQQHGDREIARSVPAYIVMLLCGLSVIIGLATADIVEAIHTAANRSAPKPPPG